MRSRPQTIQGTRETAIVRSPAVSRLLSAIVSLSSGNSTHRECVGSTQSNDAITHAYAVRPNIGSSERVILCACYSEGDSREFNKLCRHRCRAESCCLLYVRALSMVEEVMRESTIADREVNRVVTKQLGNP